MTLVMNSLLGSSREDVGLIGRGHMRMMGVVIIIATFALPKIVGAQYVDLDSKDFRSRFEFLSSFANGNLQVAQIDQSRGRSQDGLFVDATPPVMGLPTSAPLPNSTRNLKGQDSTEMEGPEPRDLIERIGGMPMDVPSLLDDPVEPRQKAILERQRVLNRFNQQWDWLLNRFMGIPKDGSDLLMEMARMLGAKSAPDCRQIPVQLSDP